MRRLVDVSSQNYGEAGKTASCFRPSVPMEFRLFSEADTQQEPMTKWRVLFMRALLWCLSIWSKFSRRRNRGRLTGQSRAEILESRQLLTLTIQFDYSRDTNHFFDDTARRQILELAGEMIGSRLDDHLLPIVPSGGNTWSLTTSNPSGNDSFTLDDQSIPEDTILVFVDSRNMSSLGVGGPGGYSSSGSEAWLDLVAARGQTGMFEVPESDFGVWGGSITFDNDANWYFGMSADGQGSDQQDFLSVAMHELGHVLGIGTAGSWDSQISGRFFTGKNSVAEYGGNVPLSGSTHFHEGTEDDGSEAAMDPSILVGTRKLFTALDYAALADIGWELNGTEGRSGGGGDPPPIPYSETYTINVDPNRPHLIVIVDDDVPNNGRSRFILNGQASSFLNPTTELIINGGFRTDFVLIQSLDAAFAAKITINVGFGADRVDASAISVAVSVVGAAGRDTLIGGAGNDTLLGGHDDDSLIGNGGADSLVGEAGIDRIFAGSGNDILIGGDGNDHLYGQAGNDTVSGGAGKDSINGGDDDDLLNGEIGRDTLLGGLGNDSLDGGVENDNLQGQDGNDLLQGGDGNDSMTGSVGADTLQGNVGNDTLNGGLDDDLLLGGEGNDRLLADAGNDTLNGGEGSDTLFGGHGNDALSGFAGNDSLLGDDGNDTLIGGDGKDRLRGGRNNDLLRGGLGNDRIDGETDADTVSGGNGARKDPLDKVIAGAGDLVDELFVFDAEWIDAI